ncbi:RDD family protein [Sporolactobacillus shoreae]|nr:RDD family protein [Sporolactobacillus shoreae]
MQSEPWMYAPLKTRICAFLLDYLVIAVYGVLVLGTLSVAFRSFFRPLFTGSPAIAELTGFALITLPVSLYFLLCERSDWQGTWGKKKMSLRVVDGSGRRIGLSRSILRTAIKFLPWEMAHFAVWHMILPSNFSGGVVIGILIMVYLAVISYVLSPLLNKKKQTIYDRIAGTAVIRNEQRED